MNFLLVIFVLCLWTLFIEILKESKVRGDTCVTLLRIAIYVATLTGACCMIYLYLQLIVIVILMFGILDVYMRIYN